MLVRVLAVFTLLAVGAYGQFPFGMFGFNPAMFNAEMQGLFAGLQNMGANIQSMTQNMISENMRRAQESGTYFDTNNIRPGEFRRFTDPEGNNRGFAYRSADGQSGGFSFSSGGQGSGYFFTSGPDGRRFYRF